jgi:hypothetical protein
MEHRLFQLAEALRQSTATGQSAASTARKLEWVWERDNEQTVALFKPNEHI